MAVLFATFVEWQSIIGDEDKESQLSLVRTMYAGQRGVVDSRQT